MCTNEQSYEKLQCMPIFSRNWKLYINKVNKDRPDLPAACKSLSVLTNAATSERGSTASHSSLVKPEGVARRTLLSRLFFAYMAAPDPWWPSNSYKHVTQ